MYQLLSNRSVVELTGSESLQFIQNLITNDIIKNNYCYSYMLSNQGKYLFDFFIFKEDSQKLLIDVDVRQIKDLVAKLTFYKLRAAVNVQINDNYKIIYSKLPLNISAICSFKDPRFQGLGFRSIVKDIKNLADICKDELYEADKYNFAIPDGSSDLIVNKSIPLEYGAEELKSINYEKGCYVGQEFNSRTKYQGVIRKKIYKVISNNELVAFEAGAEVKAGEIQLGICSSYYKNYGIALIRVEKYIEHKDDPITIGNNIVQLTIPEWRQG